MKQRQLRKCLHEALEKDQFGILIWPSKEIWEEHKDKMTDEDRDYNYSVKQLKKGEEVTIMLDMTDDIKTPGVIGVSTRRMAEWEEYFLYVWNFCNYYEGPIVLVPSRKMWEFTSKNWLEKLFSKGISKKSLA